MQCVCNRYERTDPFRHGSAALVTNYSGNRKNKYALSFSSKAYILIYGFHCKIIGTKYLEFAFVRD